ncbi:MAG: hypothetical protein HY706_21120 [Candidatus Hydrogenedentes bacterium]|nr:hypothetical protein [Candidatus Hydrogenedentota bacterium]
MFKKKNSSRITEPPDIHIRIFGDGLRFISILIAVIIYGCTQEMYYEITNFIESDKQIYDKSAQIKMIPENNLSVVHHTTFPEFHGFRAVRTIQVQHRGILVEARSFATLPFRHPEPRLQPEIMVSNDTDLALRIRDATIEAMARGVKNSYMIEHVDVRRDVGNLEGQLETDVALEKLLLPAHSRTILGFKSADFPEYKERQFPIVFALTFSSESDDGGLYRYCFKYKKI